MKFEENCLYLPLAPADSEKPKGPNRKESWDGPTVKSWNPEGKGCFTWEERQKTEWDRWGIVNVKGSKRLLIIDFDLYKMDEERKNEIIESYNEKAPKTRVHTSLHGGMHLFYLVNPKHLDAEFDEEGNAKAKLPVKLAEHIDDKLNGYVVDTDCEGYEVRVDKRPATIDPRTDLPEEWLKHPKEKARAKTEEIEDKEIEKRLKTALNRDKKFEHLWHGRYEKAGFGDRSSAEASLASKIGFWFGRNEKTIEKMMEKSRAKKWHEREDSSYRDSIIQAGLKGNEEYSKKQEEEEEKKEEKKIIETSKVEMGDTLAEEIVTEAGPMFLYLNDGNVEKVKEFDMGDCVYKPRDDEAVRTGSVLLPTGVEDYRTTTELIEDVRNTIHRYVDVSEQYERLASWYVVMTWGFDQVSTLSYLRVLGDTGTGKSRFLNVVGRMCYKPIIVSGAVTPAPIYRLIKQWEGTLIIDEGDLRKSDEKNEVVTILNCGFERGRPVIRCTKDDPDNIRFFKTFGPKLIATRQEFFDKALERRCLTEKMTTTTRREIPDQLPEEFYKKAEEIRNKLLKWRLENISDVDVNYSRKIKMGNLEPGLKQATRCFFAVFKEDEVEQRLFDFLETHQRELIEQRAETWEGMIINTIFTFYKEWKETLEETPTITPGMISESIQNEYSEDRLKPGVVGRKLRAMGLETDRRRVQVENEEEKVLRRVLVWDEDRMEQLFKRYVPGYAEFVTDLTDVTVMTDRLPNVKENFYKFTQEESESERSPSQLSKLSCLSQTQQDILDFMDEGVAYSHYDIADEFALSDEEAKGRLESLYDQDHVKKRQAPDGSPLYARSGGENR